MAAHLKPHPPTTPRTPALEGQVEFTCIKCEYSLAGLAIDGSCPECGAAIRHSITGDRLEFADVAYLARLSKGAWQLKVASTCFLAMVVGGFLLRILLSNASLIFGGSLSEVAWTVLGVVAAGVFLFAMMTWFLGTLRLLTPDPDAAEPQSVANARTSARFTAKIAITLFAVFMIAELAYESLGGDAEFFGAAMLVPGLAFFIHFQRMCAYMRWLARRIPDSELVKIVRRARIVSIVVAFWVLQPLLDLLSGGLGMALTQMPSRGSFIGLSLGIILGFAYLIIALSPLVWIAYTHSAIWRLSRALRRAHLYAAGLEESLEEPDPP